MLIAGIQKLTLLDYPGRTACTIFLGGCNFNCPYCHNKDIIDIAECEETVPRERLIEYFRKRGNMLEGVCISGGEPLMSLDTADLMYEIKSLGYDIKLDTNGSYPGRLAEMIREGLCDYVAMDIKNSKKKYPMTTGSAPETVRLIEKSVEIIECSGVDHEYRTTLVNEFHEIDDIHDIARMIEGTEKYFLQNYRDPENGSSSDLHPVTADDMKLFVEAASLYVPGTRARGEENV